MTVVLLGNSTTGFDVTANGNLHILPEGRYLSFVGDAFDFGLFSGSLVVNGLIASELDGIDANNGTQTTRVTVNQTGSVTGDSDGIEIDGLDTKVVNHGYVTGLGDNGIEVITSSRAVVVNSGTVFGTGVGVALFGDVFQTLDNSGKIRGISGVEIATTGRVIITNTGTLSGIQGMENSVGYGVRVTNGDAERIVLSNSGTIAGSTASYNNPSSVTVDVIYNSGAMLGSIGLGGGNDVYNASPGGYIQGVLAAGDGNDTIGGGDAGDDFRGDDGADELRGRKGDDTLDGGDGADLIVGGDNDDLLLGQVGNDTLFAGDGNDTANGGDGNDLIMTGAGNDSLSGGKFADTLKSGAGDDTITGDAGADRISAGADDDMVFGGDGADIIWGGRGEDTIDGGLAADELWGGGDADVFVLNRAGDSTNNGPDRIRDFEQGEDRLDLSGLGDLEFVGSGGFTGGGQASVRYVRFGGQDRTEVRIDADGNGSQDALIRLDGAMNLSESDFIL